MADKPVTQERRAHPVASASPDESQKKEILKLMDDVGGDPVLIGELKRKFIRYALAEEQKFNLMTTMYQRARCDELTGLLPVSELRWKVVERLEMEPRANTFAVLYVDAMDFKKINDEDTLGHSVGDKVIIRIAEVLSAGLREQDMRARLGGDEFVGATFIGVDDRSAPEDSNKAILRIVDRCCADFEQTSWAKKYPEWAKALAKNPDVAEIKPALNAGVIIVHAGGNSRIQFGSGKGTFHSILKMAEKMMYKSKRYEKKYGHRRIFYRIVGFEEQRLKLLAHGRYDSPIVTQPSDLE